MDPKEAHPIPVCGNKMMIVSNPATGKVIATAEIGAGTDGVAGDCYANPSARTADGNITMVGETAGK
jgi:hypothetical protein